MQIRFKVSLGLARKSVLGLIGYALQVVDKINASSAIFLTPHPALSAISSAIADLQTAANNAAGGGIVQVTIQRVMRIALENLITECGHYVEDVANDPANAVPIDYPMQVIEAAGMTAKRVTIHEKRVFGAKATEMPGTVQLVAARAKRGTHDWQYTLTPLDESSWVSATSTTKASTIIDGLTSLSRYYFRHRALLKSGTQVWDDAVSAVTQ